MFHLTIRVDDLDAFVADPDMTAVAEGWVGCPPLGGQRPVERGVFNLFVPEPRPEALEHEVPPVVRRPGRPAGDARGPQGRRRQPRLRPLDGHDVAVHDAPAWPRRSRRRRRSRGAGPRHPPHPRPRLRQAAHHLPGRRPFGGALRLAVRRPRCGAPIGGAGQGDARCPERPTGACAAGPRLPPQGRPCNGSAPSVLLATGREVGLSSVFARFADKREQQAVIAMPELEPPADTSSSGSTT